ncbi:MAG: hypothetical protein DIU78_009750 [Pseudomonadota bacterium]
MRSATRTDSLEDGIELSWSSPPGCPNADAVREKVRALAGNALRTMRRVRATGHVVRQAGRYRLTLTLREGGSVWRRTLDSESCTDLAGAAAVVLGLFLDRNPSEARSEARPSREARSRGEAGPPNESEARNETESTTSDPQRAANESESASAEGPTPEPREDPESTSASPPSRSESSVDRRGWRIVIPAPVVLLDLGPLSDSQMTYGGGLGVHLGAWRLAALGRLPQRTTLRVPSLPQAEVELERFGAELWGCWGWRFGPLDLAPCITGAFDHRTARGAGRDVSGRTARSLGFALGGGAAVRLFPVEWAALTATAAARVETSRPRLVIDGLGEVARLGPAQLSFSLGSEWIF